MSADLAAEIRAQSARLGITLSALSEAAGVGYRTTVRKTRGESPLTWDDVEKFSRALRVKPSQLVAAAEQQAAGMGEVSSKEPAA